MTKSRTMRKSAATPVAPENTAPLQTNGAANFVPGVRLCIPEPLSHQQLLDACEEQIRELAYLKWEAAGCPSCDGFDFWLEAQKEVLADRIGDQPFEA